jgi:cell wall-associated NlpC family hydrolase
MVDRAWGDALTNVVDEWRGLYQPTGDVGAVDYRNYGDAAPATAPAGGAAFPDYGGLGAGGTMPDYGGFGSTPAPLDMTGVSADNPDSLWGFYAQLQRATAPNWNAFGSPAQKPQPTATLPDAVHGDANKARGIDGTKQWDALIKRAAGEAGIPWQVIAAVMGVESEGQNLAPNSAGALGLMQVVPGYWQATADKFGGNLSDPYTNIRTGAEILKQLHDKWGTWDQAFAGYLGALSSDGTINGNKDANGTDGWAYVAAVENNLAALGYGQQSTTPTGNERLDKAVKAGMAMVGTPYVWGGATPADGGFDCSGLMQWIYAQAGVALTRTAEEQYNSTQRVSTPQVGDLIFFKDTYASDKTITHVGLFVGFDADGHPLMLQAPDIGQAIDVVRLDTDYWQQHFAGYGRVAMGADLSLGHRGLDAPARPGTPVAAVRAGHLLGAGHDADLGHYAVVFDGHRLYTYGHLAAGSVPMGEHVRKGGLIGHVGHASGYETGPHVHLAVHDLNGSPLNPLHYLD